MMIKIIKVLWKIIEVLWIMVAILLLMFGFYIAYYPDHGKDDAVVFSLFVVLISSPGGYLFALALESLPKSFDIFFHLSFFSSPWSKYWDNFLLWIIFVVIGYLQWFRLLPYLVGKLWGWKGWRRISVRYRAGGFRLRGSSSRQAREPVSEPDRNNHDP